MKPLQTPSLKDGVPRMSPRPLCTNATDVPQTGTGVTGAPVSPDVSETPLCPVKHSRMTFPLGLEKRQRAPLFLCGASSARETR